MTCILRSLAVNCRRELLKSALCCPVVIWPPCWAVRWNCHWLTRRSLVAGRQGAAGAAAAGGSGMLDIVIPVFAGLEDTLRCIDSVLATVPACRGEVVVVDDASPEADLRSALDALAAQGRITLLRNSRNLGFPGAANRGLRLHPLRDALLLNSDCEVFGGLAGPHA